MPDISERDLVFEGSKRKVKVGGFGAVSEARYKGGLVAVKTARLFEGESGPSKEDFEQLKKEYTRTATALGHPNVVTVLGLCHHSDGTLSIVMELAEDGSLADLMKKSDGPLGLEEALKYGLDVARGVEYCHSRGLVHCDLKCDNIFLDKGTAMVGDFGLAKVYQQYGSTAGIILTSECNGPLGTIPFMAPEQFGGANDPDLGVHFCLKPSDIYSLGCILYELCTGVIPWTHDPSMGAIQITTRVLRGERPPLDGFKANKRGERDVPAIASSKLREIISACWVHDPTRRPSSSRVAADLLQLYTTASTNPHPHMLGTATARLMELAKKYDVRSDWAPALRNLSYFDVVFIADDSGSMLNKVSVGSERMTRWEELRKSVTMVSEIASILDSDGIDVYFLNQEPILGVTYSDEDSMRKLKQRFDTPPCGGTPLKATLERVINEKGYGGGSGSPPPAKRLLILLATDGVPTDCPTAEESIEALIQALRKLPEHVFVQIMAITDDKHVLEWMNEADSTVRHVDCVDDYNSEQTQIKRLQGKDFKFSVSFAERTSTSLCEAGMHTHPPSQPSQPLNNTITNAVWGLHNKDSFGCNRSIL